MIENIFGLLGLLVDTKVRRSTVFSFSMLERSVCCGMFLPFSMAFSMPELVLEFWNIYLQIKILTSLTI